MVKNRESIEQLLQVCLELLFSGKETVDSLLARYPDQAEALRPELEAAAMLHAWKQELSPRPGFVAASRKRMVARIRDEAVTSPSLLQSLTDPLFWQFWLSRNLVRLSLVGVLVLVFILNLGRVAVVSQQALPGDRLYPVKRAIEQVELAVTVGDTGEAALNLKLTERRLSELQGLARANRYEHLSASVEELENQVNQTIQSLDEAADEDVELTRSMAESLASILIHERIELDRLANQVPEQAQPVLKAAAAISESAVIVTEGWLNTLPPPTLTAPPPPTSTGAPPRTQQVIVPPTSAPTRTPLPTRTPRPTSAPTQDEPVIPPPTRLVYPTPAPIDPNPTDPVPTMANTPLPTNTPRPTDTPVPPTETPRPTNTPVTPTDTPIPPTNTPRPTDTPVSPTNTPVTPTDTPVPPTETPRPTNTPATPSATPDPTATGDPGLNQASPTTPTPGPSTVQPDGGQ